ncbi:MAG: serine/threonine protein kinase [Actinomycetota bacterium]|nr:serine/threonine protein kinase [Actinomycetota bacterium]
MIANRYQLSEQIGSGGMATVWKATDTLLGRNVAVKRLLPHLAVDPRAAERFRREARSAARLSHPGIVTVFDTGKDENGPFIILELVEGNTLAAMVALHGAMRPTDVVTIVSQIAMALDYAHAQGVVHRDVKPANLILDSEGRVRLTDFGIAKTVDDPTTITDGGELVGTFAYIAPEILDGADATPASDVYSLAAVTYEMLAGRAPFSAETPVALLESVRRSEPKSLIGTAPGEMVAAVSAGMSKDPIRRPHTAGAFASQLTGATLVMASDVPTPPVDHLAPTITLVGSDEPTLVTSPPPAVPAEPAPGKPARWPLLAVLVGVIAIAAAAASADRDPAEANGQEPVPLAAGTTTTALATTTPPTTSFTVPAATTAVDTPEIVALEIRSLLAQLDPPQFKPNEVRRVEDRLEQVMEIWEGSNGDDLAEEFDKVFDAVADLEESAQQEELTASLIQLAALMGLEIDRS